MNKLISSTFLYSPPIYPTVFSNKWKRNLSNVERDSLDRRAKKPRRCESFATLIKSPTLPLCSVSIPAIKEDEIHQQQ